MQVNKFRNFTVAELNLASLWLEAQASNHPDHFTLYPASVIYQPMLYLLSTGWAL
jgi:hypothetical protein